MSTFNAYPAQLYDDRTSQDYKSIKIPLDTSMEQSDPVPWSPFTTSPNDSDMHLSCVDLSTAFSNANINPLEEKIFHDPDHYIDAPSSATSVSLLDILRHFPSLPSFIHCEMFPTFANLWFEFKRSTALAEYPINRPQVQKWLKSAALQIHCLMVAIVKSNPNNEDPESQARCMFSAFRRLKDHIEIAHQVFCIVENGRVFFNQTPHEAIAPLMESAVKINQDVCILLNSPVIPVIEENNTVSLKNESQVTMKELSNRVLDTYNLMHYHEMTPFAPIKTEPEDETNQPMHESLFSHIQPSLIHHYSSLPVTPYENAFKYNLSLPSSPTCTHQIYDSLDNTCAPCNSVQNSSLSPSASNSPLNALSQDGESDYEMDMSDVQGDISEQEDEDDDDEYVASDTLEDEDWNENKVSRPKRVPALNTRRRLRTEESVVTTRQLRKTHASNERHYTRRTATSYDVQTTHYLKSIFFDIYSTRDKLTKEQRRQVQKETGLKPRNITYWFSNHKRRFQNSLLVFKKTVLESNGAVKTYDDFLDWRKQHGLPEEVLEHECVQSDDNKQVSTEKLFLPIRQT